MGQLLKGGITAWAVAVGMLVFCGLGLILEGHEKKPMLDLATSAEGASQAQARLGLLQPVFFLAHSAGFRKASKEKPRSPCWRTGLSCRSGHGFWPPRDLIRSGPRFCQPVAIRGRPSSAGAGRERGVGFVTGRVTTQQQQQQQEAALQTCIRCGGIGFFYTPISDPRTNRTMHLFRCKTYENQQWTAGDLGH